MSRFLPLLALLVAGPALAQTGTVAGRVVDAETDQPLVGASVRVDGSERGAAVDAFGRFVLHDVPAGQATVVASFVGFETARQSVAVAAGETVTLDFALVSDPDQIGEVVIRSEKFVRNLQDTQTSVGVVTNEEIEAIPVRDWEDAALLVGNVSTSGEGTFNIRGIADQGTATLYVDGVPQGQFTTSRTVRGTWDVESVEVFRGPQSTVSGRNALAGAVYVRSAAPSFEPGAAARVRGGSQDALEGAFMVTGPLVADQLAFRVSGEAGGQDTDISFLSVDEDAEGFERANEIAQRNVKGRLLFTPTAVPGLSALLSYTYGYDRPVPFTGVTDVEARATTEPIAYFDETTHHQGSLEVGLDLTPALTLTSLTTLNRADYVIDGLTYQTGDPDAIVPVAQRGESDDDNTTQELRLNLETGRTQAVLGGYYGRFGYERSRFDQGDVFPIVRGQLEGLFAPFLGGQPLPRFGIVYEATTLNDVGNENVAVFGEVNHEVVDGLTLTAGLRYDRETFDSATTVGEPTARFEGAPEAFLPFEDQVIAALLAQVNTEDEALDTSFDAFLPKLGVVYDVTDDVSVGATVQRGYRAGGAQLLVVGGLNEFDPEYTTTYELAVRTRLLDGRLVANANVFYTDWTDQQVQVPVEGTTFLRTVNAGESTLVGGELELRAVPVRGLTAFSSLGLVSAEYDAFESGGVDYAGFAFPGTPGETFAIGAIYDRGAGPFGALSASYVGENFSAVNTLPEGGSDPALRAGDYTIVDAQLGYVFRVGGARTRVTGFARNLLDETARDYSLLNEFGQPVVQLRPPRVVGLSLDVEI